MKRVKTFVVVLGALFVSREATADTMTLRQAIDAARSAPQAAAARARAAVSQTGFASANKLLRHNPTLRASGESDFLFDRDGDRSLAVALSQTIEIGGQQGLRRDRAHAEAAAGAAELRREQIDIVAEVTAAFYSAEGLARQLELDRDLAALHARIAQTAQALVQRGSITRPEAVAADLERVRADAAVERSAGASEAAERRLAALVGRPAGRIAAVASAAPTAVPEDAALVARALATRPELAHARARRNMATSEESLAAREVWLSPTLELGLRDERLVFGRSGLRLPAGALPELQGVDNRMTLVTAEVSFALPVFEQRNSDRARARALVAAARGEEIAMVPRIEGEVRAAAAEVRAAARVVAETEKARALSEEAARLYESAFIRGALTVNDALLGHERILRARQSHVVARTELNLARARLDVALGCDAVCDGAASVGTNDARP